MRRNRKIRSRLHQKMLYVATMRLILDEVFMMSLKLSIASIVGALCLATSASAATCSVNSVHFTLTGSTGAQCMAGNDLNYAKGIVTNDLEFFDFTGWKIGDSTVAGFGDGFVNFLNEPVANTSSGSWSLASLKNMGSIMIVLKAGHQFGAFLLADAADSLSGTWSVSRDRCDLRRICTTIDKPLTHASIYYTTPAPVPVPAAGLMLLGGLGGLAALRRKRKAA